MAFRGGFTHKTYMLCLFALVVVALFVAATAHVSDLETGLRPIRSCDDTATDNRFYSYHIHVLYWQVPLAHALSVCRIEY